MVENLFWSKAHLGWEGGKEREVRREIESRVLCNIHLKMTPMTSFLPQHLKMPSITTASSVGHQAFRPRVLGRTSRSIGSQLASYKNISLFRAQAGSGEATA